MAMDSFRTWALSKKNPGKAVIKSTDKGFQVMKKDGSPASKDNLNLDEARKLHKTVSAAVATATKGQDKKELVQDGYSNNQKGKKRPDKTAKSSAYKGAPKGNASTKKDFK